MAKTSEHFRQSDVTVWGIVALVAGAVAVMSANVSTLLPQGALSALHKPRLEGANLEQLRGQVSSLQSRTLELQQNTAQLTSRFELEQQRAGAVTRRVGALEVSVPNLLEALPPGKMVDRSNVTASIDDTGAEVFDADGGSVIVRRQPMAEAQSQDLPAPLESAQGIAIGPALQPAQAGETWRDLSVKLGSLLMGLSPRLAELNDAGVQRIVVGPLADIVTATTLCTRLEQISISCQPSPFTGTPL